MIVHQGMFYIQLIFIYLNLSQLFRTSNLFELIKYLIVELSTIIYFCLKKLSKVIFAKNGKKVKQHIEPIYLFLCNKLSLMYLFYFIYTKEP